MLSTHGGSNDSVQCGFHVYRTDRRPVQKASVYNTVRKVHVEIKERHAHSSFEFKDE